MDSDLAQLAINAALTCNWQEAILLNTKILKADSKDIDALNRLARAYAESGNLEKAKLTSEKVLKIDRINSIATKCLLKWKNYKTGAKFTISPDVFIEEPGKTKIVNLINLGDDATINALNCGETVKLVPHAHRMSITTLDDKYIGRFSDDLAAKFINLIRSGSSYEGVIKSADKKQVKIFIRLTSKNGS